MSGLLGKKDGYDPDLSRRLGRRDRAGDGHRRPVRASSCSARRSETDGYEAAQIGLVDDQPGQQEQRRPMSRALREGGPQAAASPRRVRRARRTTRSTPATSSASPCCSRSMSHVDVVRRPAKGKGFQGVMKRHNFRGGQGQSRLDVPSCSRRRRSVGGSGSRVFPGHAVSQATWVTNRVTKREEPRRS